MVFNRQYLDCWRSIVKINDIDGWWIIDGMYFFTLLAFTTTIPFFILIPLLFNLQSNF